MQNESLDNSRRVSLFRIKRWLVNLSHPMANMVKITTKRLIQHPLGTLEEVVVEDMATEQHSKEIQ